MLSSAYVFYRPTNSCDDPIFVTGAIDETAYHAFASQLFAASDADPDKDLTININSPGGSVHDGLEMIDLCKSVPNQITVVGTGHCASMGAMILACAASKGRRKIMPNCEVMLHQPLTGIQGQASDVAIAAVYVVKLRERLYSMLAESTGKPVAKNAKDFDRDRWMTSEEALAYGLIDEIVQPAYIDSAGCDYPRNSGTSIIMPS